MALPFSRFLTAVAVVLTLGVVAVAQQDEPTIPWSADRKLTWADFRAKAPGRLSGAQSVLGYSYALGCRSGALEATFTAVFYPNESWVAARISTSGLASPIGLRHEQLHFNLKELHARRMRRHFREIATPCPVSDETLDAMVAPLMRAENAEQQKFDQASNNGERVDVLEEWERRVAGELTALAAFAR